MSMPAINLFLDDDGRAKDPPRMCRARAALIADYDRSGRRGDWCGLAVLFWIFFGPLEELHSAIKADELDARAAEATAEVPLAVLRTLATNAWIGAEFSKHYEEFAGGRGCPSAGEEAVAGLVHGSAAADSPPSKKFSETGLPASTAAEGEKTPCSPRRNAATGHSRSSVQPVFGTNGRRSLDAGGSINRKEPR